MIGDLKFMFMVCGRNGYAGAHCLYCFLKASKWKEKHQDDQTINPDGEEVTVELLMERVLKCQQDASGTQVEQEQIDKAIAGLAGQKEAPLWTFIPIENYLVPLLHLLLGLGNDLLSNFFK